MSVRRYSNGGGHTPSILAAALCAATLILQAGAGSGPPQPVARHVASSSTALGFRETSAAPGAARVSAWQGGRVTASTGEQLTLYVSDTYGPEAVQRWADFFARLPHGSELTGLTAYVAPYAEVRGMCGVGALGCYSGNELATIGDPVGAVSAEEVARHEYGHHVAWNRSNAPWLAVAWGTKRWATHANVCARAAAQSAYPGDEGSQYHLNPGEAFAEAYRVMAETKAGETSFTWTLVDSSFYPDANALAAAERDVMQPWTAPVTRAVASRFRPTGPKSWALKVATPLDGSFEARLTMPSGTLYDIAVVSADGKTTLAKSLWSAVGEKRLTFTVCGQRSLVLRVVRKGEPGRFRVTFSRP